LCLLLLLLGSVVFFDMNFWFYSLVSGLILICLKCVFLLLTKKKEKQYRINNSTKKYYRYIIHKITKTRRRCVNTSANAGAQVSEGLKAEVCDVR